jgi:hypothetical protein
VSNGENVGSNHLLGIALLLAVAAVALYMFVPAGTVDVVAQRVGIQPTVLGLVNTEREADPAADRPVSGKSESIAGRATRVTHDRKPTAEDLVLRSITTNKRIPGRVPSNPLKNAASTGSRTFLTNASCPIIKVSSLERGHLIERCVYGNGSIEVRIDGEVVLAL